MNMEKGESVGESREEMRGLFAKEIRKALSPTWAKSTQELLPGYLPNKLNSEYTPEELERYRCAYKILGDMVKDGTVEVIFDEEAHEQKPDSPIEGETVAIPRFKLITSGGKKSKDEQFLWQGKTVLDSGVE